MHPLPRSTIGSYDVFRLSGRLTASEVPQVAPEIARHVKANPGRNIAIDLSSVETLDSTGIYLLVNLKKHTDAGNVRLVLIAPSPLVMDLLSATHLNAVFSIIADQAELYQLAAAEHTARYLPYCHTDKGLNRLNLSCAVCGSRDTVGYLVDPTSYRWSWQDHETYPAATDRRSGKIMDVFGLQPVICTACFMCSLDLGMFNVLSQEKIALPARISDGEKSLLAKSTKRRKGMIDANVVVHDAFFEHPRTPVSCYNLFVLAGSCAQTLAINKHAGSVFSVGFISYLAIRYATLEQTPLLIDNCRTWLTKAASGSCTPLQRAQAYFALMVAAFDMERPKEAQAVFNQFSVFMNEFPPADALDDVTAPVFWYSQCKEIWAQRTAQETDGRQSAVPA